MSTQRPHIAVVSISQAPADARDPFAWLTGTALRELHRRDPDLGRCENCSSTEAHCPYALLGWEIARQALADPGTLPPEPPS